MTPNVVKNFLLKPMERYWDDFEPTLDKVRKDMRFINGFFKKNNDCSKYELNALEHAKSFGEHIVRLTTIKHTSI